MVVDDYGCNLKQWNSFIILFTECNFSCLSGAVAEIIPAEIDNLQGNKPRVSRLSANL